MNNRELTPKEIAEIQLNYPLDSRIELVQMNDKWAVPPGTRGTVDYVDDAGQIHMKWDNGRTLAIIPQADNFRKLTRQEIEQEQLSARMGQRQNMAAEMM